MLLFVTTSLFHKGKPPSCATLSAAVPPFTIDVRHSSSSIDHNYKEGRGRWVHERGMMERGLSMCFAGSHGLLDNFEYDHA